MYDQTDESYCTGNNQRFLKMYKHWNFGQKWGDTDSCVYVDITKQTDKVCGNGLQ